MNTVSAPRRRFLPGRDGRTYLGCELGYGREEHGDDLERKEESRHGDQICRCCGCVYTNIYVTRNEQIDKYKDGYEYEED